MKTFNIGDQIHYDGEGCAPRGVYVICGVSQNTNKVAPRYDIVSLDSLTVHQGILGTDFTPHHPNENRRKHHDVIVAWAKGATIQIQTNYGGWKTVTDPVFCKGKTYRVLPKPDPMELEIKKIEKEMRELADRLQELRANSGLG